MRNLNVVLLVSLALAFTPAQALPNPPSALVVIDLGPFALVSWVPGDASGTERYDVYGLDGALATYLGSTESPATSFLAPGGYDSYRVVAASSGQTVGVPCVATSTNPPDVVLDFYCGRGTIANAIQYAVPLP